MCLLRNGILNLFNLNQFKCKWPCVAKSYHIVSTALYYNMSSFLLNKRVSHKHMSTSEDYSITMLSLCYSYMISDSMLLISFKCFFRRAE